MEDAMDRDLTETVIGAAVAVHRELGPGLLESVYERALALELRVAGVPARQQVDVPVAYRDEDLGVGFRADLIVAGRLIVEIKSVSRLEDVHFKQLLTYLRLARLRTGLLINFNTRQLIQGLRRASL
jgi:GxxExxY protein